MTGYKHSGVKITTIIVTVIAVLTFIGGVVKNGYSQLASVQLTAGESKEYTDKSVKELKLDLQAQIEVVKDNVAEVKSDTKVMRAILEERFPRKK